MRKSGFMLQKIMLSFIFQGNFMKVTNVLINLRDFFDTFFWTSENKTCALKKSAKLFLFSDYFIISCMPVNLGKKFEKR
jgi:hypothetical protein